MKLWTATLYLLARYEVQHALRKRRVLEGTDCVDCLAPDLVPSLRLDGSGSGSSEDRVLAEVDQDGFVFALDIRDRNFFHHRGWMIPRERHRIQIVLSNGAIQLRKTFVPQDKGVLGKLRNHLQWEFYLEAAALLRLRGIDGVPMVRKLKPKEGVIEMDYIWGRDLRQVFANGDPHIDYGKVSKSFDELLSGAIATAGSEQLFALLDRVIRRGVIPRDLHAANLVLAFSSQSLYLVDFNLVYLPPVPGCRSEVQRIRRIVQTPISSTCGSRQLHKNSPQLRTMSREWEPVPQVEPEGAHSKAQL